MTLFLKIPVFMSADLSANLLLLIDYCRDFSHIFHICTRPPVDSLMGVSGLGLS